MNPLLCTERLFQNKAIAVPSNPSCSFTRLWTLQSEALDVSGSLLILSAPQAAWFASMQWILREDLPLGDTEVQRAGGNCHKFRNLHFKKVELYQVAIVDSCYFWGRCASGRKIPVFTQGSVLHFLETCSSAVRDSCDRVLAKPSQGWEFPHMSCTGWTSPGKWEQRKLSCPICPWWLLSKDTPAVLRLCKHCHTAMVYLPQGLNSLLFTHSTNPENTVLSVVASFCVPVGMEDHTLPAPTEGEGQL